MPTQRKRILLMVSSMRGGGSERQVLMLAQELDRSRFDPHLYLTEAAGELLDQIPSDIPIHSYDRSGDHGGLAGRLYVPGRQLRRQTEFLRAVIRDQKIDVVYDRTFHMTLLAGKAANGVRRVSTIVSPPHLAVPFVEKRFVALKRRRLAAAYQSSDVVVAVSRPAAESAESYYGLDPQSVLVVKNPVDADRLRRTIKSERPTQSDQTLLLCVGRMTEEKGHRDLIDALTTVQNGWPDSRPPLALRLIGDGPLRGELELRVASLGLTETVTFGGSLKNAANEIAQADALVLPSRFEGMPNVVLESMALGVPVIATRTGGTIELERDQPTAFWAEPADARSIADAIKRFAENPQEANDHCAAARRLIEAEHNLPRTVRRLERLFDPQ
jgi:glycosyltransferase involved in cell wall biosynthesis